MVCPKTFSEYRRTNNSPCLISLDRIDSDRSYISTNVVFCCKMINYFKNTMKHDNFIDFLKNASISTVKKYKLNI